MLHVHYYLYTWFVLFFYLLLQNPDLRLHLLLPAATNAVLAILSLNEDGLSSTANLTNASEIGSPVLLSLTVIVRYVFSSIFTGFFVYEYSSKNWFDNCELLSQSCPTIPSNNDENVPPAISFVMLQKLSPSVAMLSSPSNAAALPSP